MARAVAASSAEPVVFNPVVVGNYFGCNGIKWPPHITEMMQHNQELAQMYRGLDSYGDKENRKYIHFVDGGITDNMVLCAMSDVIALAGGPGAMLKVTPHFIQVTFDDIPQPQLKLFLNKIPTSFSLTDEQVDTLIESARTLLRSDPGFQQLLAELGESR